MDAWAVVIVGNAERLDAHEPALVFLDEIQELSEFVVSAGCCYFIWYFCVEDGVSCLDWVHSSGLDASEAEDADEFLIEAGRIRRGGKPLRGFFNDFTHFFDAGAVALRFFNLF